MCFIASESTDRLRLLWKVKDRMPSISRHSNRTKCVLSVNEEAITTYIGDIVQILAKGTPNM